MDIIIFATMAVFIAYKLFKILGQEDDTLNNIIKEDAESILKQANKDSIVKLVKKEKMVNIDPFIVEKNRENIKQALKNMAEIDESFNVGQFVIGAKKAYEMIVEAFNKSNRKTLRSLLGDTVYQDFASELDNLEKKNHHFEKTLISLDSNLIVAAEVKKKTAFVTFNFVTEQINLVRDADNKIVSGSSSKIDKFEEKWQFSKDLTDSDPNWYLVSVDV